MPNYLTITLHVFVITYTWLELFTISAKAVRNFNYESNTFFNNYTRSKHANPQFKK